VPDDEDAIALTFDDAFLNFTCVQPLLAQQGIRPRSSSSDAVGGRTPGAVDTPGDTDLAADELGT
jgi:hypothetical protein